MVAAPGMPPEWADVTAKAQQVERLNPAGIQGVADQFNQASRDSADHTVALRNATAALGGGTWSGPSADAFFDYVKKIADAGQKVNDHLDEVSRELSTLQGSLSDIKNQIQTIQQQAQTQIDDANNAAVAQANAAEAQEKAVHDGKEGTVMPSPTSAEIMATNARNTSTIAAGARDHIQTLLNSANDQINHVMDLVKQDVEGGYSSVPPLGTAPAAARGTGGLHSGGSHYSGGGGGDGGGGGGGGLGSSGGPPTSPPPGNVQQWIDEAIKALQAAGVPVTDADIKNIWAIIQHESGGNPNAINLWDCVPLDTMILTQRGWLKHDEVRAGDTTIGYNFRTGHSEWTPITRIVHHENAPLVRLSDSRWHATTTPNHRWLSLPRVPAPVADLPTTCPECGWRPANGVAVHRRKTHRVVSAKQRNVLLDQPRFVITEDVRSRDRIMLSACAETPSTIDISVREAAILGWIAGDGNLANRTHRPAMSIAQSKPEMVDKIKRLLEGVPHALHVDDRGGCGPRHRFHLNHDYARDLLARAGNPKSDSVTQVLAMSTGQRNAWLDAVIDAEGTRTTKPGFTRPRIAIHQAPGSVLEAVTLAVYLSGRRPRVLYTKRSKHHDTRLPEASVRANTPVVSGALLGKEDVGRGAVWCVTTVLGTWTAREDDHVFLTGNSNAQAGHPSKGLMQCIDSTFDAHKLPGHDNIYNPVDNIIAGVRYTISRYGSIANTPGLQAMAHGGGYVGY